MLSRGRRATPKNEEALVKFQASGRDERPGPLVRFVVCGTNPVPNRLTRAASAGAKMVLTFERSDLELQFLVDVGSRKERTGPI
jgi:hypothetical protein